MTDNRAGDGADDESASAGEQGAGPQTGSLPLGIRARARRLYRARRERLLQVPVAELRRRYGERVDLDDEYFTNARVDLGGVSIEVGFAGTYKMFGALIDTQWVALRGELAPERAELTYRFDKERFVVKRGADDRLAISLSDRRTRTLAGRSELKAISVLDDGSARKVTITPLPGTITAMYFPPLPPYTVPMKSHEATDHLDLMLHLIDL